ncbi:hypothetical protein MY04_4653 [Flammeovirga sp. MY04]|uniref:hypothetical protein n=1 Tax=Flammeovirga sp. MY04 TaxID=1191459 RepID=UPI00082547A0|nr:hypothetical protein [Flammeovirga sp. MY04]ANQ51988.2 hypothetical protein MY04_4653 [Flammeovirga sp. MY04]
MTNSTRFLYEKVNHYAPYFMIDGAICLSYKDLGDVFGTSSSGIANYIRQYRLNHNLEAKSRITFYKTRRKDGTLRQFKKYGQVINFKLPFGG